MKITTPLVLSFLVENLSDDDAQKILEANKIQLIEQRLTIQYRIMRDNLLEFRIFITSFPIPINKPSDSDTYEFFFHRLIHNFLASTYSLKDCTKKVLDNNFPDDNPFSLEIQQKKDEFFTNNLLVKFVHNLRNYIAHYQIPTYFTEFNNDQETKGANNLSIGNIAITANELLGWDGWNKKQREYIKGFSENQISLLSLFESYLENSNRFYSWLYLRIRKDNKEILDFYDEVANQWFEDLETEEQNIVDHISTLEEELEEIRRKIRESSV